MLSQTHIRINGQEYKAVLEKPVIDSAPASLSVGCYTNLYKGSRYVGVVNVFISDTLKSSWSREHPNDTLNWVRDISVTTLPYINIECDEEEINSKDLFSFLIMFVSDRNEINGRRVYIKAEWDPKKQVEKLVYNDEIEDEKVEQKILEYLGGYWQQDAQPILVKDLVRALYVDPKIIERSRHILEANKYVIINEYSGSIINGKIIIRTDGINKLRDMRRPEITTPVNTYNVSGDLIQGSKSVNTTYGQGSHIIQDSQDIKIINENIDNLIQQLDKDYKDEDKNGVMAKVRDIKDMVDTGSKVADLINKAVDLLPKIKNYAAASLILLKMLGRFYLIPAS